MYHEHFSFENPQSMTANRVEKIIVFLKQTGIWNLFKNRTIKNLPDYVLGIEVGLDSNGRKNRSGTNMENIVENFLIEICRKNNYELILQATSSKIQKEWNITVKVDKTSRRFDFVIQNKNMLYFIETNFYGGGGSKLKATAGEYKSVFDFISSQNFKFIWITDGLGWKSALRPLEETFNHIDYILNLKMISQGLLSEIIKQKL